MSQEMSDNPSEEDANIPMVSAEISLNEEEISVAEDLEAADAPIESVCRHVTKIISF